MLIRVAKKSFALLFLGVVIGASTVSAQNIYQTAFYDTWTRSDAPITAGKTARTWMWGPGPYSDLMTEPYADALGGERQVVYFDKSRMEINNPNADPSNDWYVTNGLLALELITGRMQVGDSEFEHRASSEQQIAGDQHPDSPSYSDLQPLLDEPPTTEGTPLTSRLQTDGSIVEDQSLGHYGPVAAYYVHETAHTVAGPFWGFMNSAGTIYPRDPQGYEVYEFGLLFPNPFFATGFPITEAYWVHVPVAGVWQDVLVQCFERRCLTFTPGNDPKWMVEAGNIGQHYYQWRYGKAVGASPDPLLPPGVGLPGPRPPGCVNINTASVDELTQIIHVDEYLAHEIIERRPYMYVDSLTFVPGISSERLNDIKEQGLACA